MSNTSDPYQRADLEPEGHVAGELRRYARLASDRPSTGFAERVMAAVEHERMPRRGLFGMLTVPPTTPLARLARAGVLAAAALLTVGGALAAGELVRWLGDANMGNSPSPVPSPLVDTSATPVPTHVPVSPSPSVSAPESPQAGSAEPTGSDEESPQATSSQSPQPTPEGTATPDESDHGTPEQSASPTPSASEAGGGD